MLLERFTITLTANGKCQIHISNNEMSRSKLSKTIVMDEIDMSVLMSE